MQPTLPNAGFSGEKWIQGPRLIYKDLDECSYSVSLYLEILILHRKHQAS